MTDVALVLLAVVPLASAHTCLVGAPMDGPTRHGSHAPGSGEAILASHPLEPERG